MKFGCFGCLFLGVGILLVLVLVAGVLFLSGNIFMSPDARPVSFTKADGYAAQQKLYEVILRQTGQSTRKDPITLTEREASAFLSRHLGETERVPLSKLTVRFDVDEFVAQGETPLRTLVQNPIFSYLIPQTLAKHLDQPIWVTVRGKIAIQTSSVGTKQYGIVKVTELILGRQPVSPLLLYVTMGPSGGGLFEWPVPGSVDSVQIQKGQAIIRTR